MTKLLANSWISAPIGAVIYLLATVLVWEKPVPQARQQLSTPTRGAGPSWDFNNPEVDQLITELKMEKQSVQQRQQQLDDLATRLNTERAELSQVIQSVRQLQGDFDKAVLRVKDDEAGNLKKLAKVYAAMNPEAAANVLEQLENQAVVKIMIFLKEQEAAGILEAMSKKGNAESRRAAQISEQIRLSSRATTPK